MSIIEQLQEACEYDPMEDSPIDNLIDYKDSLEDLVASTERALNAELDRAREAMDADNKYWEDVQTGQDSEEAETSGMYAGVVDGLEFALATLRGERVPR